MQSKHFQVSKKERKLMLILVIVFVVLTVVIIPIRSSFQEAANDPRAQITGTAEYLNLYVSMCTFILVLGPIVAILSFASFLLMKKIELNVADDKIYGATTTAFVLFPKFELKYSEIESLDVKRGKLVVKALGGKKYYCAIEDAEEAKRLISEKLGGK